MLIGDLDPYALYKTLAGSSLDFNKFLAQESLLNNLYQHNFNDGAKLIRTVTKELNPKRLILNGIKAPLEACLNLAINSAKKIAIKNNILTAAVISIANWVQDYQKITDLKDLDEYIILIDDFAADLIIIQDCEDINLIEKIVIKCAKLSNLPVAAFYKISDQTAKKDIDIFTKFCDSYKLELTGIQIDSARKFDSIKGCSKISGLLIDSKLSEIDLNTLNNLDLILADKSITRADWKAFTEKIHLAKINEHAN